MAMAAIGEVRLTSDPVAPEQWRSDIVRLFEALTAGGIGIVPLDVAYNLPAPVVDHPPDDACPWLEETFSNRQRRVSPLPQAVNGSGLGIDDADHRG